MLIDEVNNRVTEGEVTQEMLARALGLSQGHLSKILNETIKPGRKTVRKLERWMAQQSPRSNPTEMIALAKILEQSDSRRRKLAMQIIHALSRLLRQA